MHRDSLLRQLRQYQAFDADELKMVNTLVEFVRSYPQCFERSCLPGHVTGSAWIVDKDYTHVLLTHHRKLDRWLQLGGHADGESDILQVALREAREESGIDAISPVTEYIFDVDVHPIPERGKEPPHLHYDVRYLLVADKEIPLVISNESKDLAWVPLDNIKQFSPEASILRMAAKLRQIASS